MTLVIVIVRPLDFIEHIGRPDERERANVAHGTQCKSPRLWRKHDVPIVGIAKIYDPLVVVCLNDTECRAPKKPAVVHGNKRKIHRAQGSISAPATSTSGRAASASRSPPLWLRAQCR